MSTLHALMTPLAIFGINSSGLNLAIKLLVLFLVAIWAALVYWTYADARRRIEDPMLVGSATVASLLFPFVGTIVYAIVRPPEYLDDVRERELEIAAAEARLHQVEGLQCPYCDFEVGQAAPRQARRARRTAPASAAAERPSGARPAAPAAAPAPAPRP